MTTPHDTTIDLLMRYIDALTADPAAEPPPGLDDTDADLARALVCAYDIPADTDAARVRVWQRTLAETIARRSVQAQVLPDISLSDAPSHSNGRLYAEEAAMIAQTTTPLAGASRRQTQLRSPGRGFWTALVAAAACVVVIAGLLFAARTPGEPQIPGGRGAAGPKGDVSATATVTPTSPGTIAPPIEEEPLPSTVRLDGIRFEAQDWNNQGPASLAMALSYFGWEGDQYTTARWLKPNTEDKNVSPWQMARYVNDNTELRALWRMGGTGYLLKRLLAAGFPVIIETGFQPAGEDWMGHYRVLMGYDDDNEYFLAFDSYLGSNEDQGRKIPYTVFDEEWRHFNRVFIVAYEPEQEQGLFEALAGYVDPVYGYQAALDSARSEVNADPEDKWAWFNLGTAYTAFGDYQNAANAFDRAYQLDLPFRMLWYQFGPYEAYYQVGRYADVLALASTNQNVTSFVEETYYWQGMAHAARGNYEMAVEKFDEALSYNPNFFPAQDAKAQVEAGTFAVLPVAVISPTPIPGTVPPPEVGPSSPMPVPVVVTSTIPPPAVIPGSSTPMPAALPGTVSPPEVGPSSPMPVPVVITSTMLPTVVIPDNSIVILGTISPTAVSPSGPTATPTPVGPVSPAQATATALIAAATAVQAATLGTVPPPSATPTPTPAVVTVSQPPLPPLPEPEVRLTLEHERTVNGAAWNADGSRILSWADDGTARIWDAVTGDELVRLNRGKTVITGAAWSPDESQVLTWSGDGTVTIWDVASAEQLLSLEHGRTDVRGAIWRTDGEQVLTWAGDGTAHIWDAETGEELVSVTHQRAINGAVWSANERHIFTWSDDGTLRTWDAETGEVKVTLNRGKTVIIGAAWSPGEHKVLAWSMGGGVMVWGAAGIEQDLAMPADTQVQGAVWSADETRILTSATDGTARVWDVKTGEELVRFEHDGAVYGAVWSAGERCVLTWSEDGTARVWDALTGTLLQTLHHSDGLNGAAWSPDERAVLTWSGSDVIWVWSVAE